MFTFTHNKTVITAAELPYLLTTLKELGYKVYGGDKQVSPLAKENLYITEDKEFTTLSLEDIHIGR